VSAQPLGAAAEWDLDEVYVRELVYGHVSVDGVPRPRRILMPYLRVSPKGKVNQGHVWTTAPEWLEAIRILAEVHHLDDTQIAERLTHPLQPLSSEVVTKIRERNRIKSGKRALHAVKAGA
jgi:hypothetical protein